MNEFLISDEKFAADKAKKISIVQRDFRDEEWRKRVRRAVKNIRVPADLEAKMRRLLREQSPT